MFILPLVSFSYGAQNIERAAAEEAVAIGIEAMRTGQFAQARAAIEKALNAEPENAEANLQLGLLLGQFGDIQAATEAFRKAVRAKPDWPEAHYNLGLTMVADPTGKRDWPLAMAEFREALRLRPSYADAHHLLGIALAEVGQREAAIAEFHAALAANPSSPETHLDLGKAFEAAGDQAAAEHEYRESIRLRTGYTTGEFALGNLLLKRERAPGGALEAIEHFRNALRANPDNAAAQYALAKALREAGHSNEAAVAFRQAAALTKRQEEAAQCTRLSNEGLDSAHRGDTEAAIRNLRDAVALGPDSAIAHYNLGLVLADQDESVPAAIQITEAISLQPAEPRFYATLGRVYLRHGDRQHARAAFEMAAQLQPGNVSAENELMKLDKTDAVARNSLPNDTFPFGAPADTADAHFAFATILANRGDWIDAAGEWLRVLALNPNHLDARNNLGVSYAHLGRDDQAELEFRKALQFSTESAGAHFGLAVLALNRGNRIQAVEELRQVIRIQPNYPQAQQLLAQVPPALRFR